MVLPSRFFKNFYAEKVNEIGCVYDELRLPCCGPLRCAPLFCRRAERTLIVKKHMKRNSILLTALLVIVVATLLVYGVFSASGTPPSDLSEMSGGASPGAASEIGSTGSSQAPSDLPSESSGGASGTVAPGETRISFLACPDNIIHPSVYYDAIRKAAQADGSTPVYTSLATGKYDFADMYEYVADAIRDADISYVNVETLIGGNDNKISGYPMFNTPEQAGEQLIALGFDIYNLAHNHMLDSNSDEYLINCNRFFESRGLTTLGYYKDQADVSNIKISEHEGVKIAFLAYTYSTNGLSLQAGSSTVIPYISESLITQQMELAKAQADLVFVSMHWGDEDRYEVNAQQRSTAQLLVDLGADVIIGMHPHVIQEMKWVEREDGGRCLLTYSLGNFISGMQDGFNMLGGMLAFDIVRSADGTCSIESPQFLPVVTHYTKETAVSGDDTGHRNYKIYPLEMYTEELAAQHGVQIWDQTHTPTLVGGAFTVENLKRTVKTYIPAEFLADWLQ